MAYAEQRPGAYQEVRVQGADSRQLVVMLFQGLMKFLGRAQVALEQRNYEAKAKALNGARRILDELGCSLDEEQAPELAKSLRALYEHLQSELTEVDLQDDLERLAYVIEIGQKLCETWEEALQICLQEERQSSRQS